jgi:hypothetical protein
MKHQKNNLYIECVYGRAGTGKTFSLCNNIIKHINNKSDFVVLAYTHSAVLNIVNMIKSINTDVDINVSNFCTLHSYFRINFKTGKSIVKGPVKLKPYIFIDEFSLINKTMFKKCIYTLYKSKIPIHVFIYGDPIQLPPIEKKIKVKVGLNKLYRLFPQNTLPSKNNISHMFQTLFFSSCLTNCTKTKLTENKRSDDNVLSLIENIYSNNILGENINWVGYGDIPKLISDNYVFIASKHKIIQQVIHHVFDVNIKNNNKIISIGSINEETDDETIIIHQNVSSKLSYKFMFIVPHTNIITTENTKSYMNGEELKFVSVVIRNKKPVLKCINSFGENVYISQLKENNNVYFPIYPSWVSTIHRAQGRSIDNIIACVDDLFNMCMLYTMITRTKHNIIFFTKHSLDKNKILTDNAYIDDFNEMNKILFE